MQRGLEKGSLEQKLQLADYIIYHLHSLIEDPYGNYLVQNVLKLNDEAKNEQIFKEIAKNFIRLSQLKFSSNVIEKCLEPSLKMGSGASITKIFRGSFDQDDYTINRELGGTTDLKQRVSFIVQKLIYNQFGNYVL